MGVSRKAVLGICQDMQQGASFSPPHLRLGLFPWPSGLFLKEW